MTTDNEWHRSVQSSIAGGRQVEQVPCDVALWPTFPAKPFWRGVGAVFFRNFTLSAQWGRLNANGGVLRAADGSTLSVPVTGPLGGTTLQGDGWSATLNSGWVVRPAARPGSFAIVREN